ANGIALGLKLDKIPPRVYCIMGDGEIQEGQVWEAAMTAAHYSLDNLCAIVDNNGLQIDGPVEEVMKSSRVIITAEEHSVIGGLGGAVCEFLAENHPVPVRRIGSRDLFGCSGSSDELLRLYGLTANDIVKTTREALKK
ncbi:MAG: thiamine pyrophosphate-dependent enzyme, partial [Candidatus Mariimomonas ferrooxydans]